MSQPAHTSLDAPYRAKQASMPGEPPPTPDASGTVLVIGRGNWQQGAGNGDPLARPKWMPVVEIDGRVVHGTRPQVPFAPGESIVLPGETPWGEYRYLDLARLGFADGELHSLKTSIYAASYWPGGWGDNAAQPSGWEWGHYGAGSGSPAVFVQSFQLAADVPAPPPVGNSLPWMPHLRDAKDDLELAVYAYTLAKGDSPEARKILFRQRFAMMQQVGHCTDAQRKQVHEALAPIFGWPT